MKNKPPKSPSGESTKRMMINKAISRFIKNTQKIVQKVKPDAEILIPKQKFPKKKKRLIKLREKNESSSVSEAPSRHIRIPEFNEITLSDLSDTYSDKDIADSEELQEVHHYLEQNEYFVRARPEIRKVKGNGRSTEKIHVNGETSSNLHSSLSKLGKLVPENVFHDYLYEGVNYLSWPVAQTVENLNVTFNRYY